MIGSPSRVPHRLLRAGSAPAAVMLLVAANLVPLAGVVFFDWDVLSVLVMYWIENGIVGLLNAARMALAQGTATYRRGPVVRAETPAKATMIPFFVAHYGIFWVVHGVFVFAMPSLAGVAHADASSSIVAIGAVALALSHSASFIMNYVRQGEYRTATVGGLFFAPYGRVVVLHLTILLGGLATLRAGEPVVLVVLLVMLKTTIDLVSHLIEHARAARRVATAG